MQELDRHSAHDHDHHASNDNDRRAAGKRTRTSRLPAQRNAQPPAATTGDAIAVPGATPAPIADACWFATGGTPLAAPVRAHMESALGADLSHVRIHQDGQAEALGATAFARGSDVHFARGAYDPDSQRGREVLGHELVHVLQQQHGRVAATVQAFGAAINDDHALEAEADHLGAAAARGERVTVPGSSARASAPVAQGLFHVRNRHLPNRVPDVGGGKLIRVADDASLALVRPDPKWFLATDERVEQANQVLDAQSSHYRLAAEGDEIALPGLDDRTANVRRVVAHDAKNKKLREKKLIGPENCDLMAQSVTGPGRLTRAKTTGLSYSNIDDMGVDLARYILGYGKDRSRKRGTKAVAERRRKLDKHGKDRTQVAQPCFRLIPTAKGNEPPEKLGEVTLGGTKLGQALGKFVNIMRADPYSQEGELATAEGHVRVVVLRPDELETALDKLKTRGLVIDAIEDGQQIMEVPDSTYKTELENQTVDEYRDLSDEKKQARIDDLGLNQHADPELGEAFGIFPVGKGDGQGFPFHWAGVIAKAGSDTVAFENYAGNGAKNNYFDIYGPLTNTSIDDGKVTREDTTTEQRNRTTFHGQWAPRFTEETIATAVGSSEED